MAEPGAQKDRSSDLPVSKMISGISWHQQLNGLFCGPASVEIVYDYWGPDIDQKKIADVTRSSSSGTWTQDIVRAGHFSYLSSAQGRFFPNEAPEAGYEERPLGYAAFSYSSDRFWLPELKSLIAADIPVIVLTSYLPDGGGGHYKVVIGYDDNLGVVFFSDPWGRDLNHQTGWTGVTSWTYEEFSHGWNYDQYGTEKPYFGVAMIPWIVEVSTKGSLRPASYAKVSAKVTYPCPSPFDSSQYPASNVTMKIMLPEGIRLESNSDTAFTRSLSAGSSFSASWSVFMDELPKEKTISVQASGNISGHVPEAWWSGNSNYYPPYDYTDAIGSIGMLKLEDRQKESSRPLLSLIRSN